MSHTIVSQNEHIREIVINRAAKLNALNSELIQELSEEFRSANEDKDTRVIILTGVGEKAFVAGADISEFAHFSQEEGRELSRMGQELLFTAVEQMTTPVIAAINGFALGGGLELALSCHMRIASDNARLGLPEVSLGVIPGYGGTQRLSQLIGKGRALEMITSAQMVKAIDAYGMGLINRVTPQEALMEEARSLAKKICQNSPTAISAAIRSVNAQFSEGINGYKVETDSFGECFKTKDFVEGTAAFLEKRKPVFTGE
ncbi:MAG: enoyl-CoA hydratase-related protein [Flavobacteriales bacterium]|nr:enoyl-CoA hydratase-related protein [Flavobacteriales bacterium]